VIFKSGGVSSFKQFTGNIVEHELQLRYIWSMVESTSLWRSIFQKG